MNNSIFSKYNHFFKEENNRKVENYNKFAKGNVEVKYTPQGMERVTYRNL